MLCMLLKPDWRRDLLVNKIVLKSKRGKLKIYLRDYKSLGLNTKLVK